MSGSDLIAIERHRQQSEEGYDAAHDAGHAEELAHAGAAYALADEWRGSDEGTQSAPPQWPWAPTYWKPVPHDRIRELVKAGALIAAAIDALLDRRPSLGGDAGTLAAALRAFGNRLAAEGYGWEAIITREDPSGEVTVAHLTTANPDPDWLDKPGTIPVDAIDAIRTLPHITVTPMRGLWVELEQVVNLLRGWIAPDSPALAATASPAETAATPALSGAESPATNPTAVSSELVPEAGLSGEGLREAVEDLLRAAFRDEDFLTQNRVPMTATPAVRRALRKVRAALATPEPRKADDQ